MGAHHAMHYSYIRGLAMKTGVWLSGTPPSLLEDHE